VNGVSFRVGEKIVLGKKIHGNVQPRLQSLTGYRGSVKRKGRSRRCGRERESLRLVYKQARGIRSKNRAFKELKRGRGRGKGKVTGSLGNERANGGTESRFLVK